MSGTPSATAANQGEHGDGASHSQGQQVTTADIAMALDIAIEMGHVAVVEELIKKSANINKLSANGETPLRTAIGRGHIAIVQSLLQMKAQVDHVAFDKCEGEKTNRALPSISASTTSRPSAKPSSSSGYPSTSSGPNAYRRARPPPAPPTLERTPPKEFPPINIAPFVHPSDYSDSVRQEIARAWDESFRTAGFASIEGHGVPEELIDELLAASREFFTSSEKYKLTFHRGQTMTGRSGFSPMGQGKPKDMHSHDDPVEGYRFVRDRQMAWSAGEAHPVELGSIGEKYCYEVERVMHALHRVCALALGMEEQYFEPFYTCPASVLVMSHYPALHPLGVPDGKMRYRAHSDYTGLTILLQDQKDNAIDGGGGLEIDVNSEWVPVKPNKGCFVVNIGDLWETWTNDRWRSTPHRVSSPPLKATTASESRFSVMLFSGPNLDSLIGPIPTCVDATNPARYAPMKASEHLKAQYMTKSKEADYKSR